MAARSPPHPALPGAFDSDRCQPYPTGDLKLTVNGEPREVQDGATVLSLLEELGVARERVAVEVNLEVVRRARHADHPLRDGDHVEIVSFVGGG